MTRYANNPRRERLRSRILAAIKNDALTAQQLADRLHLTRDGINVCLQKMKAESPRLIHVSGYVYNPAGGRPAPQYRPGDLPDAVYRPSRASSRHAIVAEQTARAKSELKANPMTCVQLAQVMGLCAGRARLYIADLRANKQAYIKGWATQSAGTAPIYAIGNRPDAPKPVIDGKVRYARLKARHEKDDDAKEAYQRSQARRQLKNRIARMKFEPQTPFSALFAVAKGDRDARA
jgi:hypothetical protein